MAGKQKRKRLIPDEERKKNLVVVRVKDDEMEALEQIAEKENLPVSYFVRQGIKMVIEKRLKH